MALKIIESTTGREALHLGISVRQAGNSYGKPVCVEPYDKRDEGFSLSVYEVAGQIVGVVVVEEGVIVGEYGLVPGEDSDS